MSYEYVNARLRAMRGNLLAPEILEELSRKDFEGYVELLSSLPGYENTFAASLSRFHGLEAVEWALKEDLTDVIRRIRRMTSVFGDSRKSFSPFSWESQKQYLPKYHRDPEDIGLLVDVVIQRWDVFNVKTLLRAKHSHTPSNEIDLLPVGRLDVSYLQTLLEAKNVKEVCQFLINWEVEFAKPLQEGLRIYEESGKLMLMELYLDRYYFERGLHIALGEKSEHAGALRQILETEIDALNILSVLKMLHDGGASEYLFILGGRLPRSLLTSLLSEKKREDVLEKLASTTYQEVVHGTLPLFLENGNLSILEKHFEDMLLNKARKMYTQDPLGLGVLIGYLWMKISEVINLKIIAYGLFYKIPAHSIREKMRGERR